ncbi:hypothetical protein FACS1894103_4030 [Campylobacterota bacterium]|nr:hypothetical protein FACS1894103_4030 [Campylobacterota bacterium]
MQRKISRLRAFSMIELIFAVIILGMLSAIAIASYPKEDTLQLAIDNLITNIRFTQHLALMDDKYIAGEHPPAGNYWQRYRWRLRFSDYSTNPAYTNGWIYSIFADRSGTGNNTISLDEFAINPLTKQYMSGGFNSSLKPTDPRATPSMALINSGVTKLTFNGCTQTIAFDEYGRPYNQTNDKDPTLLRQTCKITMIHKSGESMSVCILPVTGYASEC